MEHTISHSQCRYPFTPFNSKKKMSKIYQRKSISAAEKTEVCDTIRL